MEVLLSCSIVLYVHLLCMLQVFGDESSAVIDGLPSLTDSSTFFQTDSAGPANSGLQDMQQERTQADSSDDDKQAAAEDMDQTDLPAPAAPSRATSGVLHTAS